MAASNVDQNNENYGLSIIADTNDDLQSFQEICSKYFLPISKENSYTTSHYDQTMLEKYLTTAIDYLHTEYAIIILLKNVQLVESLQLSYKNEFSYNNKLYRYHLRILIQNENETNEELVHRILHCLLGERFRTDHDDHESIPSLPTVKQPQFVSIRPYSHIACWHLPGRRDWKRFQQDLGVTHVLTLLNDNEISKENVCHKVESAGMKSLFVPIEGAELPVFASSQATVDVVKERLPSIRDLLLNSTMSEPVKMIIHCAAGLHRTGTITYLLLRLCNFTPEQALFIIHRTRAITARDVGQQRIDAAEYNLLRKIL